MSAATRRRLVVVGDALLDRDVDGHADRLCPDAPAPVIADAVEHVRPGGAALAAALAAADGHDTTLVSVFADDAAGELLRALLAASGVEVVELASPSGLATNEKVRIRAGGQVIARLDRGDVVAAPAAGIRNRAASAVSAADVVLVSDYGRGVAGNLALRELLGGGHARRQVVWDPHPRGPAPTAHARVVTPNERELRDFAGRATTSLAAVTSAARSLARRWGAGGVAVTLGRRGAVLVQGDTAPLIAPADAVDGDTCGAGDRFAVSVAAALLAGAVLSEAVVHAVASAGRFVAAGGVSGIGRRDSSSVRVDAASVIAAVRARSGTVVAAGGCFDLLHAGHVHLLQQARQLGDALVILLNSDRSVLELKGPGRPIVPAVDRAAVLGALACVDAVVEFDEPTPCQALEQVRPDVFVKGGDYGGADLPEQELLAMWGGQCVVLPYLDGRSTTTLCQEVRRRGLA
jgi:rfaE bifunctional protein nucleotidyltransferase chain/domain/rfaE bifunctional protein kinase chain/domain